MMRSGAIKGAGPFFSGREPHVPAIQSYPTPKQIYLHVTPPTGNSEEANKWRRCSYLVLKSCTGVACHARYIDARGNGSSSNHWLRGFTVEICSKLWPATV